MDANYFSGMHETQLDKSSYPIITLEEGLSSGRNIVTKVMQNKSFIYRILTSIIKKQNIA